MKQQKKRILVVGVLPPPYNGMSVVFANLCNSKLNEEFDLIILDIADRRNLANVGKLDLVNIVLALKHGFRFIWLLLKHQPDLVYLPIAQGTLGYLRDCLFLIPSRIFRFPVVVHLHGSEFHEFYQTRTCFMRVLVRFSLRRVNRAIVLGKSLTRAFKDIIPEESISVIQNGISTTDLPEKVSMDRKQTTGVTITYLGSLKPRKGYLELLYCIPKILMIAPTTKFIFAGEKCHQESCLLANEFIRANHLQNNIEFAGVVAGQKKCKLLSSSDIFCFPPVEPEGQPLVIIEAMSYGLPVISTRQGAIPDLVVDGRTGYLVNPGNRDELCERIIELIQHPGIRKEMGKKGKTRFEQRFTREIWEDNLLALFSSVLKPQTST